MARIFPFLISIGLTSCPAGESGSVAALQTLATSRSQLIAMASKTLANGEKPRLEVSAPPGPTDLRTEAAGDAPTVKATESVVDIDPTVDDAERVLVSIGRETWIYAEPKSGARRLGYLRFGAVVGRAGQPASRDDCPQGWFRISPDGYVCNNGRSATLDLEHKLVPIGRQRPDRMSGLPYVYGAPKGLPPPLYARLPTPDEQHGVEATSLNVKLGRWARTTF